MFIELLEKISGIIRRSKFWYHSISPKTQLAVDLQVLASESFQMVIASALRISQTSASRRIIAVLVPIVIQFSNSSGQQVIGTYFLDKYKFPLVFRSVDGSHVAIVAPSVNEDV